MAGYRHGHWETYTSGEDYSSQPPGKEMLLLLDALKARHVLFYETCP
jgi:hypothetical protein